MVGRLGWVITLAPFLAVAHGQIPLLTSVAARPGHPSELVAGSTFGALVSQDGGLTWDVVCELVLSTAAIGDPKVLFGDDGALWATSSLEGVSVSRDGGCTVQQHPDFSGRRVTSLVLHPGVPGTLLATLGDEGVPSALLRSDDDGATFHATALMSDDELFTAVCASAADPERLYVSAQAGSKAWLHSSDDGGKTFTATAVSAPSEDGFEVVGVSPVDAKVVFAVSQHDVERVVLRGSDLVPVLTVQGLVRGIEFSADGSRVWVASTRLYGSDDGGATFTPQTGPTLNACIRRVGETLWACGWEPTDGWVLGTSKDVGVTWQPALTLSGIRGVLSCPAGTDTAQVCTAAWPALKSMLGVYDAPSGAEPSVAEPGEDVQTPPAPTPPPAGGCSSVPDASATGFALGLLLLFALRVRRVA